MKKRARPPKRGYHHGDLRNALLRAALDLVARRGAEAFSLREAARAVGVSPAAAYRHFADKSALLTALSLEGLSTLAVRMKEALARAPGEPGTPARATAELAALGQAYVEFAVANPSHFRVMFGPWCDHPQQKELPMELFPDGRDPYQLLVEALDALVRTGAITAEARQGGEIAAWASVHGLASLLVEGSVELGPAERRQAIAAVLRTVLAGLGAPLPAGAPVPAAVDARPRGRQAPRREPARAG